jgi:hypothetical protein
MASTRKGRLILIGAFLAGVIGTAALVQVGRDGDHSSSGPARRSNQTLSGGQVTSQDKDPLEVPADESPIPFGERVSLDEAEAVLGAHLYRPDHNLASDSSIVAAFAATARDDTGAEIRRVAVSYESGVLLLVEPATGPYAQDAGAFYERIASDIVSGTSIGVYAEGTTAEVQSISGLAALVTQNPEGFGDVDLVLNGLRIEIGAGYARIDARSLVEVAKTWLEDGSVLHRSSQEWPRSLGCTSLTCGDRIA